MRKYIDENDKKNEIRLLFKHPLYKDKIIMVVEGKSDIKLFRGLFNTEMIKLESIDGKNNILGAMSDLADEYPKRILAISDADHSHLTADGIDYERLCVYLTDYHDAEIMLVNSPSLEYFVNEYSSPESLDELKADLLSMVLDAAYPIGLLRWLNSVEDLGLRFEGINFRTFIDVETMRVSVDEIALIDEVIRRSSKLEDTVTSEYLINSLVKYREKNGCKLQVSCGHDVTKIISIIYQTRWASLELNMDHRKVESALRIGFQKRHFMATNLYKKIESFFSVYDWEIC